MSSTAKLLDRIPLVIAAERVTRGGSGKTGHAFCGPVGSSPCLPGRFRIDGSGILFCDAHAWNKLDRMTLISSRSHRLEGRRFGLDPKPWRKNVPRNCHLQPKAIGASQLFMPKPTGTGGGMPDGFLFLQEAPAVEGFVVMRHGAVAICLFAPILGPI